MGEVLHNDDDDNGWSYALMAFVEYCRENGFDLPANDERPWRQLGIAEATSRGSSIRGGVSMPPSGRSSPAMVADGKEWVIRAVKNPKLFAFTYIVEARILVQRAQGLSGAYRSVRTPAVVPEPRPTSSYLHSYGWLCAQILKVTTKADSPLCLIDPLLRKLHFGSFASSKWPSLCCTRRWPRRSEAYLVDCALPTFADLREKVKSSASLRRSSTVAKSSGGVTPVVRPESSRLDAGAETDQPSEAESTALSSEQRSAQEGNGVEAPAAVTAEMP